MFDLFFRQRRRLILVALLTCLPASSMILWQVLSGWWGMPWGFLYSERYYLLVFLVIVSVVISTLNATLLLIPALIIIFARRWRGMIEGAVLGVGLAVLAVFCIRMLDGISFIAAYEVPLTYGAFFAALYFRVIDRALPKIRYKAQGSYISNKSAEQLWARLVPAADTVGQSWEKGLVDVTVDPKDSNRQIARYIFPKFTVEQEMHITQNQPFNSFAYNYNNLIDGPPIGGSYSIHINDMDFACHVTISMKSSKMPFTHWLSAWMGDMIGDQIDHLRSLETGQRDYSLVGAMMRSIEKHQTGSISPNARPA